MNQKEKNDIIEKYKKVRRTFWIESSGSTFGDKVYIKAFQHYHEKMLKMTQEEMKVFDRYINTTKGKEDILDFDAETDEMLKKKGKVCLK